MRRRRKREAKLKRMMEEEERAILARRGNATFWSEFKSMIPGTKEYKQEQEELRMMFEDADMPVSEMHCRCRRALFVSEPVSIVRCLSVSSGSWRSVRLSSGY